MTKQITTDTLGKLRISSIAEYVIRHSTVPVMVVPSPY